MEDLGYKKGLTPRTWILMILLLVIGSVAIGYVNVRIRESGIFIWYTNVDISLTYDPHDWAIRYWIPYMPVFFGFFVAATLSSLLGKKGFSPQELTIVYIAIVSAFLVPHSTVSSGGQILQFANVFKAYGGTDPRTLYQIEKMGHALWFLGPSTDPAYYDSLMVGGAPVPWSGWMAPIIAQSVFYGANGLFWAFVAALCSRSFVVQDKLPFPLQAPVMSTIEISTGISDPNKPKISSLKKWLLIGFLVGFVMEFSHVYPFVDPESGLRPIRMMKGFSRYYASWTPLVATFDIFAIAFAALLPIGITFTAILTYLILYIVLPIVATSTGLYPTPQTGRDWLAIWREELKSGLLPERYGSYSVLFTGIVFGMAFWTLYTHRSWIGTIFRSLSGQEKAERRGEVPTRYLTIGVLATGIFLIAFWVVLGIDIGLSLFMMLFYFVFFYGLARWRADTGGMIGTMNPGVEFAAGIGSQYIVATGQDMESVSSIMGAGLGHYYGWYRPESLPIFAGFEGFKLGEATKTRAKDIFLATVLPWIIMPTITSVVVLQFAYQIGLGNPEARYAIPGLSWDRPWINITNPSRQTWDSLFINPGPDLYTMLVVGILFSIATMYLRTIYPALLLNPGGVLLGIGAPYWVLPWVLGIAIKLAILRTGGAKMHNLLYPFAMGTLAATGLIWILSIILGLALPITAFGYIGR